MSKLVIKISVSSIDGVKNGELSSYVNIYDVTSIGKKINATLRNFSGDTHKRFNTEDFNKTFVESDLKSNRASIMFLVNNELEVDIPEVVESLKEKIIEKMEEQLVQFKNYKNKLFEQKVYRQIRSDEN